MLRGASGPGGLVGSGRLYRWKWRCHPARDCARGQGEAVSSRFCPQLLLRSQAHVTSAPQCYVPLKGDGDCCFISSANSWALPCASPLVSTAVSLCPRWSELRPSRARAFRPGDPAPGRLLTMPLGALRVTADRAESLKLTTSLRGPGRQPRA